jgi:hypothetical protein
LGFRNYNFIYPRIPKERGFFLQFAPNKKGNQGAIKKKLTAWVVAIRINSYICATLALLGS